MKLGQDCISLDYYVGLRAWGKLLSVVSVLIVVFFHSYILLRNVYARSVFCVYCKIFYVELLDPEILSGLHNFLNIYWQDYLLRIFF